MHESEPSQANGPATPPEAATSDAIPKHTTPTWEMELLISGATVFALMQLPAILDRIYLDASMRASHDWHTLLQLAYVYFKAANLVLIGAFVLYLLLRAYWVAIVGLCSVFPDGVRWDSLRMLMGPIRRRQLQQHAADFPALIERADNRASVVFGAGIGIALSVLVPITASIPPLFLASAICWSTNHWEWFSRLFESLFALYFAPLLLAMLIDRRIGARFAPEGRVARILDTVLDFYRRIGLGQNSNTPLMQFLSHSGRRGVWILLATISSAWLIVMLPTTSKADWQLGGYGMLPNDAPGAANIVLNDHYASRRNDNSSLVPFIGDPVVSDTYVQLFIPYDPGNDPRAIDKDCHGLPGSMAASYSVQLLDCLSRIHPVTLDGKPLALHYDFSSDPRSGVRGLLGMIDARALAPGRHELTILQPADPDQDRPATTWRIPFWR